MSYLDIGHVVIRQLKPLGRSRFLQQGLKSWRQMCTTDTRKVMIATLLWFWQEHLLMHTALRSALSGQGSLFLHHWQSINTLTTPCNELHGYWVEAHIQVSIPAKVSFSRCSCLWASSVQLNLRDNEEVRKAEQKVRGHSTHCWTSWAFYNVTSILLGIWFYYNCFCDRSFWCHCIFISRRIKSAFSAVKQVKIA